MAGMRGLAAIWFLAVLAGTGCQASPGEETPVVRLSGDLVRDRMAGGWVGQMVGVVAAGFTEFGYLGRIIPEGEVPEWDPMAFFTAWMQDDLYVEIPFLDAMDRHGVRASWKDLGDSFAATGFMLWHGNEAARNNLRNGIPAPDSGHYRNNEHCDDIDWQIEADFLGLMSPGLPATAAELAWRHGHLVGFGDGVMGGIFVAAMHAAAFTAGTLDEVIQAGLDAVPPETDFRRLLQDVVDGHRAHPDDWTATWDELERKWGDRDRCPVGKGKPYNIDAKMNAGYVLMGLLYGKGDFWKSIVIAMRGGQDSDCNASTVGGILGTFLGLSGIPPEYVSEMDWDKTFDYTDWSVRRSLDATERLAREAVALAGGRIESGPEGETWVLPVQAPAPIPAEQWPREPNADPVLTDPEIVQSKGLTARLRVDATDDDGISGIFWSFGDLSSAAGTEVTHTWPAPGSYEVLVWAVDRTGNSSWRSRTVTVP